MSKKDRMDCRWPVIVFVLSVLVACSTDSSRMSKPFPENLVREGDLVFRRGTGILSEAVLFSDKGGLYSHVGIVVRDGASWSVIHAVPGERNYEGDTDRVKKESLGAFFAKEKAASGALMRIADDSISLDMAVAKAKELYDSRTLFDHRYDMADTAQMYCTELVAFAYSKAGVDLGMDRLTSFDLPGFDICCLMPSTIYKSDKLKLIYQF